MADLLFKLDPLEFDEEISAALAWRIQVIDGEIAEIEAQKSKEAADNATNGAGNRR